MFEVENDVESYFKNGIKRKIGKKALCLKFVSPGQRGVPDRIILLHGGVVVFAELKNTGKKERALQKYIQGLLRKLGFMVFSSVDTKSKADEVIKYCEKVVENAKLSEFT